MCERFSESCPQKIVQGARAHDLVGSSCERVVYAHRHHEAKPALLLEVAPLDVLSRLIHVTGTNKYTKGTNQMQPHPTGLFNSKEVRTCTYFYHASSIALLRDAIIVAPLAGSPVCSARQAVVVPLPRPKLLPSTKGDNLVHFLFDFILTTAVMRPARSKMVTPIRIGLYEYIPFVRVIY